HGKSITRDAMRSRTSRRLVRPPGALTDREGAGRGGDGRGFREHRAPRRPRGSGIPIVPRLGPADGQRRVVSRGRAFPGSPVSGWEEPLGSSETRFDRSRPAMRGGVRSDSSGREFETPALFYTPLAVSVQSVV